MTRSQRVTLSTAGILAILAALALSGCTDGAGTGTDGTPAFVVYGSGAQAGASLRDGGDSGAAFGPASSVTLTQVVPRNSPKPKAQSPKPKAQSPKPSLLME